MKPILQALVVADHVYQDVTGKKIIAGTFNRMLFTKNENLVREVERPGGRREHLVAGGMHSGSPYAYISLTDVVDGTKLSLQFVNLNKNEVLFHTELVVPSKNRLQTIELVAPLPPLPVTEEAVYAFEVVWEDVILGSHRILGQPLPDAKSEE